MTGPDDFTFRFTPARLADYPQVPAFVDTLNVGTLIEETLFSPGGRNVNWVGETTTGSSLFVKSLPPFPPVATNALRRALAYEQAAAQLDPAGPLRSPRLLGYDEKWGLLAYALIPEARSLNAVAVAEELDADVSRDVGAAIAALHSLSAESVDTIDDTPLEMPPLGWLRALPVEALGTYTMAQMAAWRLMQSDPPLLDMLRELRAAESQAPRAPIHGDLRMDQFLTSRGVLYLCDWEHFRLGDPARDVGAFIGELLFQSIYLELNQRGDAPGGAVVELDHAEVMRRGRVGLDRAKALVLALWLGYTAHITPDAGLAHRAFGFAGWHMFDRLLSWAEDSSQLNPTAKAIAGIGRTLLLAPAGAARLFNLPADLVHDRENR
jgi:aminoglycoside phosphotransferase (APT) family kinase protein